MDFFECGELCPPTRRRPTKRLTFSSKMHPIVYAEPAAASLPSQYISYSSPVAISRAPNPASVMYTRKYADAPSGYGGDQPITSTPVTGMPLEGQFISSSSPSQGNTFYYPASTGGSIEKYGGSELVQPLSVPQAGTQSIGKSKTDDFRPRATTSPISASPDKFVSPQRDSQQQIKQLQMMLTDRELQLEEKEQDLRDALAELRELRKQANPSTQVADEGSTNAVSEQKDAELQTMRKRVELLRQQRQELMELLLQKERQVAALDVIDPSKKEASALQMGVQAISMVQGAAELREKLQQADAEIKRLKEERAAAAELQQSTFDKLTDKRREAAELLELLSQRDMKVARVEAYLQQKTRELEALAVRSKERLQKEQRKREEVEQEYLVAKEQCNSFKATLANRDEKLVQVQAEVVRRDTLLKQLEERVRLLSEDLNGAHAQLQQMLKGMAAKDAYMQELEAQLRKIDTERQVAYLSEVSKSRKLALDTRIQQEQCRAAINDKQEKLAAAKQDLLRSQVAMERIRKAIGSATEVAESNYARSEVLQSPAPHNHATVPLKLPIAATDIPPTPIQKSLHSMGADFLVREPPSVAYPTDSVSKQPLGSSTKPQPNPPSRPPSTSKSASLSTFLASSGPQTEYCPPYTAVQGDLLDQAVARVFENPEYRPLAAHMCRLGPGSYLFCMTEVSMELERDGRVVMIYPGGEKVALTSHLDLLRSGGDGSRKPLKASAEVPPKAPSHSLAKSGR